MAILKDQTRVQNAQLLTRTDLNTCTCTPIEDCSVSNARRKNPIRKTIYLEGTLIEPCAKTKLLPINRKKWVRDCFLPFLTAGFFVVIIRTLSPLPYDWSSLLTTIKRVPKYNTFKAELVF